MKSVIHSVFCLHFSIDISIFALFQIFEPQNVFAESE